MTSQFQKSGAQRRAQISNTLSVSQFLQEEIDTAQADADIAQSSDEIDFAVSKGLVIRNSAVSGLSNIDIDADSITVVNSSEKTIKVNSVDLTVSLASSGANGLDTGSEANSTWYHIWVIYDGSTVAGLFSESPTAPTMPSGYTYKAYVGAIQNGSTGNLMTMRQVRDFAFSTISGSEVSAGTATTYTSFSLEIPSTAREWIGSVTAVADGSGHGRGAISSISGGGFATGFGVHSGAANSNWYGQVSLPVFTSQTLWYKKTTGTSITITSIGWRF